MLTVPHDQTSGATELELRVETFTANQQEACYHLENFLTSQMTLKTSFSA
jgi:hypothetical protein